MIYQILEIVSISEIIGAIVATFFAILTWWIVEKLNAWKEWKAMVNSFNELYNLLLQKKYEANTSVEIVNSIYETIGESTFKKVLKLQPIFEKGIYKFEGNDFMIEAMCGIAGNHLKIYQYNMPIFDFRKPEVGIETFNNFISYFETQCKREGIPLRKN